MQIWKERQGVMCVMIGGKDEAAVTNKRGKKLLMGEYTTSIKFLIQGSKPNFLSSSLYITLTQLPLR